MSLNVARLGRRDAGIGGAGPAFATDAGGTLPLAALWAHGSLALGDYQPGRSDLDLIALIETAPALEQKHNLRRAHEALESRATTGSSLLIP